MDIEEWITILVSLISLFVACKANSLSKTANKKADRSNRIAKKANEISLSANDLSKEANMMSSKSISIDYDATFNDFHIQLQKNYTELFRLKNDFNNLLTQDRNFILDYMPQIKKDMIQFQTQKQFMRPSKYADHYDVLEYLCEDIKGNLDIMLKIAKNSNQGRPRKMESFSNWHTNTLKIYSRLLKDFEEKIAEVSGI
ncbi:hypothetical protein [Aerococcus urinaeequi]|uniref:hypothetical protein n=1 Tax=Aerococcus urinaeequi TaxID=51665 RepID=UPI003D6A2AD2